MCTGHGQHTVCTQQYYWVLGTSVKRFLYSLFRLSKVHWRIDRIRFSIFPFLFSRENHSQLPQEYQLKVPTVRLLTFNVLPDKKHSYSSFFLQWIIPKIIVLIKFLQAASTKGHLISKGLFGVIVWTIFLRISALASKKRSNQKIKALYTANRGYLT